MLLFFGRVREAIQRLFPLFHFLRMILANNFTCRTSRIFQHTFGKLAIVFANIISITGLFWVLGTSRQPTHTRAPVGKTAAPRMALRSPSLPFGSPSNHQCKNVNSLLVESKKFTLRRSHLWCLLPIRFLYCGQNSCLH